MGGEKWERVSVRGEWLIFLVRAESPTKVNTLQV